MRTKLSDNLKLCSSLLSFKKALTCKIMNNYKCYNTIQFQVSRTILNVPSAWLEQNILTRHLVCFHWHMREWLWFRNNPRIILQLQPTTTTLSNPRYKQNRYSPPASSAINPLLQTKENCGMSDKQHNSGGRSNSIWTSRCGLYGFETCQTTRIYRCL